jgi:hypothetical protein
MSELLPEVQMSREPDRILVLVDPDLDVDTEMLSTQAIDAARQLMPKVTGMMASTLRPISGDQYFGIYFPDRRVWFLEQGTRPFTMRNLAGKTIPMWINDPTGVERRNNPKAKTRRTVDGRDQVLIFRKAATPGQRRNVTRKGPGGASRVVSVPASYPGAPGRIARREAARPFTTAGRTGGQVARGNVGVRWRHPGTVGRQFLNAALSITAWQEGLDPTGIYLVDGVTIYSLLRSVA